MSKSIHYAVGARNKGPGEPNPVVRVVVRVGDIERKAIGRDAWALYALIESGPAGVTAIERVGPRWSHYVLKLRRAGFDIETVNEKHGGAFAGRHARYVLRSPVNVVTVVRQSDKQSGVAA